MKILSPRISIIIPTYNRKEQLRNCLDSICKQNLPEGFFEIIVVDDGSTDDTEKFIKSYKSLEIKYLRQNNKGAASARNTGIIYSVGEYVCFIDSDIILEKNCIKYLYSTTDKIVGASIFYKSVPEKIWCAGVNINLITAIPHGNNIIPTKIYNVDYIPSCVLFTKREIFDKVGFFDELFNIYYEDTDWCLRAKKIGYNIYVSPNAIAYHDVDQCHKILDIEEYYRNHINRIRLVYKHANIYEKIFFFIYFVIIENIGSILKNIKNKRFDIVKARFKLTHDILKKGL